MPLSTGQVLNNRYRIVRLLGQGGFGAVYRAWDLNIKRACALKENLDTSPESRAQFEKEALILAGLNHPNLARVSDHFIIEGQGQYLVMDYVEGDDLQQMLDQSGSPLPAAQVVEWIGQVCDALDYLHNQQPPIIHRDIKPANIKVTPEGKAILVDFGIAKIFDPYLATTVGARAVTPGYSSPEQYGQGKTDARSDIYSLGATTYTLLTGRVPSDSIDLLTGVEPQIGDIHLLNQDVSGGVNNAVHKAMSVKREDRYSSAGAFKEALFYAAPVERVAVTVEETVVSPAQVAPTVVEPVRIPSEPVSVDKLELRKRNRRIIFILGALALILLCGTVFVIWAMSNGEPEPTISEGTGFVEEGEPIIAPEAIEGEFVLWHTYDEGSSRLEALHTLSELASERYPGTVLRLEGKVGEEILGAYPEMAQSGEGPDIILTGNQNVGPWIEEGILMPLPEDSLAELDAFHWKAIEGMVFNDEIYGLPQSARLVGLYYNPSMINKPPREINQLIEAVEEGAGLSAFMSAYYLHGFFGTAGANVLDDAGRCIVDQTEGVHALWTLITLQEAGAIIIPEREEAELVFQDWEAAMVIDGPWALGRYREALGEELGFVPLPPSEIDVAKPFLTVDGFFINPNSRDPGAALEIVKFLAGQEAGQLFSEIARTVPVRYDVEPPDPILKEFFEAMEYGDLSIRREEMEWYFGPFDDMYWGVLMEGASPEEALANACAEMNSLNGK
ncbi:MAG: serine/threonine-protein kinase [Chloroflexota bacterium]|nr:serine/threonine-protein kinase [Chloroflexota bacterium]